MRTFTTVDFRVLVYLKYHLSKSKTHETPPPISVRTILLFNLCCSKHCNAYSSILTVQHIFRFNKAVSNDPSLEPIVFITTWRPWHYNVFFDDHEKTFELSYIVLMSGLIMTSMKSSIYTHMLKSETLAYIVFTHNIRKCIAFSSCVLCFVNV